MHLSSFIHVLFLREFTSSCRGPNLSQSSGSAPPSDQPTAPAFVRRRPSGKLRTPCAAHCRTLAEVRALASEVLPTLQFLERFFAPVPAKPLAQAVLVSIRHAIQRHQHPSFRGMMQTGAIAKSESWHLPLRVLRQNLHLAPVPLPKMGPRN